MERESKARPKLVKGKDPPLLVVPPMEVEWEKVTGNWCRRRVGVLGVLEVVEVQEKRGLCSAPKGLRNRRKAEM